MHFLWAIFQPSASMHISEVVYLTRHFRSTIWSNTPQIDIPSKLIFTVNKICQPLVLRWQNNIYFHLVEIFSLSLCVLRQFHTTFSNTRNSKCFWSFSLLSWKCLQFQKGPRKWDCKKLQKAWCLQSRIWVKNQCICYIAAMRPCLWSASLFKDIAIEFITLHSLAKVDPEYPPPRRVYAETNYVSPADTI